MILKFQQTNDSEGAVQSNFMNLTRYVHTAFFYVLPSATFDLNANAIIKMNYQTQPVEYEHVESTLSIIVTNCNTTKYTYVYVTI